MECIAKTINDMSKDSEMRRHLEEPNDHVQSRCGDPVIRHDNVLMVENALIFVHELEEGSRVYSQLS